MTISYSDSFIRLIFRWKGSLWKSLWKSLIVFLLAYYAINFLYRFAMDAPSRQHFELAASACNGYTKEIPLTFLLGSSVIFLGFYILMVVRRWWEQWQNVKLDAPDTLLYRISAFMRSDNEEAHLYRRLIARYSVLSCALAWRNISSKVLARFPTLEHFVAGGLMTEYEYAIYTSVQLKSDAHKQWFLPIVWIHKLFIQLYHQGKLSGQEMRAVIDALENFREPFIKLFSFSWISIPLVYTQVTTVAVYGYFGLCLVGRQMLQPEKPLAGFEIDFYVPFFTILQFLFYFGWLKVGEDLINPFGDDDEDFELNYLLDRHLEVAIFLADSLTGDGTMPAVDPFSHRPIELSHTEATMENPDRPPKIHVLKSVPGLVKEPVRLKKPPTPTRTPQSTTRSQAMLSSPTSFDTFTASNKHDVFADYNTFQPAFDDEQ